MMQSQTGVPDTQDLFDKMMAVFTSNKRAEMGKNARKFVEENYDLKKIYKAKWSPFFAKLEKEIYGEQVEAERVLPTRPQKKTKIITPTPHIDKPIVKSLE